MTVAATMAEAGASIIVIEIGPEIGGSAAISQGYVWTAPSREVFEDQDPVGDLERFSLMLEEFPPAIDWLRGLGVYVGPRLTEVLGYGVGFQIDVAQYVARCRRLVEGSGGWVLVRTEPERLLTESERVVGVEARELASGDLWSVRAPHVILATGGFQADTAARDRLLYPGAGSLLVRSNTNSRGGGLRLATDLGADLTPPIDGFYGHLLPYPLPELESKDFALLAQYHSEYGLLLRRDGRRLTDESLGDHINAEVLARHGPALLMVDERIRREQVIRPFVPGMDAIDKMAEGGRRGAHYASEESVAQVAAIAESWGYEPRGIEQAVDDFNTSVATTSADPARRRHRLPLVEPPFAVLEVQAAITFTYRGLVTDADGHVLRGGAVVPGLFAVGADAGGLNVWGYTGGLVRGLVLGRHTGKVISVSA